MSKILESLALQKQWQIRWREIPGEQTSDIPEDIYCDFLLHNEIWGLDDEKLRNCFSLFPNGTAMFKRVRDVMSIQKKTTDEENPVLLDELSKMNTNINLVLHKASNEYAINRNDEKKKCTKETAYSGDHKRFLEIFYAANSPTIALDDILRDLFEEQYGLEGYATCEYLNEPLNSLTFANGIPQSILWMALKDEYQADPYSSVLKLYELNAEAGWSRKNKEMFVFVKSK